MIKSGLGSAEPSRQRKLSCVHNSNRVDSNNLQTKGRALKQSSSGRCKTTPSWKTKQSNNTVAALDTHPRYRHLHSVQPPSSAPAAPPRHVAAAGTVVLHSDGAVLGTSFRLVRHSSLDVACCIGPPLLCLLVTSQHRAASR